MNHAYRPAILRSGITHHYPKLDAEKMHVAAQHLLGEQDFSSFRAVHCQSHTPFRNIHHVDISRTGDFIVIDIKANAFLHHMVRNITGTLLDIGSGRLPVEWMPELLALKDRTKASATAKANGLYLVDVDYPAEFGIPKQPVGPLFLPDKTIG